MSDGVLVVVQPEPVQVKCASVNDSSICVAMDNDEDHFEPGNLLVATHHARLQTNSIPDWTTALEAVEDESSTRLMFRQITAEDSPVVRASTLQHSTAHTLTVMEFRAIGEGVEWALDQVAARRSGPVSEHCSLSTGTTDLTVSRTELGIAVIGLLGDPGVWGRDFTNGFERRATVVSEGPSALASAQAVATKVLIDHEEVETTFDWAVPLQSVALLATFRPLPARPDIITFARPGIPTADAITVITNTPRDEELHLVVSKYEDLRNSVRSEPASARGTDGIVKLTVSGLSPDTEYNWGIRSVRCTSPRRGRVVTPPLGPKPFTFAASGCGGYRKNDVPDAVQFAMSTHPVWDTIVAHRPDFFLHLGDLHYQDVGTPDVADHLQAYLDVFKSSKQGRVWRRIPMAHMWGDHDFCGDNSHAGSIGASAACAAYRRITPQRLAWSADGMPVSFAFSWGSVLFVVPDCRSARSVASAADGSSKTMLGADGKAWLFRQFTTAEADPLVSLICFYTEVPWISSDENCDDWSAYATERSEIAAFIRKSVTKQILGIGSDAHMNAFDDGSNNAWGGFPVLQAGALDRCGSVKGGPYTAGVFPNSELEGDIGQFALVSVEIHPDVMHVRVSGHSVTTGGVETSQFTETVLVPLPRAPNEESTRPD